MNGKQLKKQYSDILSSLKGTKIKNDSALQIIGAIEKDYKELVQIKDNELSDVDYDFYADMLNIHCEELDGIGIKYKTDTPVENNDYKPNEIHEEQEKTNIEDEAEDEKASDNTPHEHKKDKEIKEEPKKRKHPILMAIVILFIILLIINIYLENSTSYRITTPVPYKTNEKFVPKFGTDEPDKTAKPDEDDYPDTPYAPGIPLDSDDQE